MITYHRDLFQGSEEWHAARCGLLTASEMKLILTPTMKPAANDKSRAHVWELLAQRISRYVEPHYVSDDMLRGREDEITARALYAKHFAPVQDMGFITNDEWGFTIGYSPDGLIGDDGLIECKSRRQKYQIQTMVENYDAEVIPEEYALQVQTGLLVTGRQWCDFISYSGGLPMLRIRAFPDPAIQAAIIAAATAFEADLAAKHARYEALLAVQGARLIPTERRIEEDISV